MKLLSLNRYRKCINNNNSFILKIIILFNCNIAHLAIYGMGLWYEPLAVTSMNTAEVFMYARPWILDNLPEARAQVRWLYQNPTLH